MKRRSIFLLLFLFSISVLFSQVVPSKVLRIANATTAFGSNISIGDHIYDINADFLYIANAAIINTATINTATGSLTKINASSGAPSDAKYLTAVSEGGLSNEIVVGAPPNGDLGGTWANISVDDDSHAHSSLSSYIYPSAQIQTGNKTSSFTHDCDEGLMGAYTISNTVTVLSIHNLEAGVTGTLFFELSSAAPVTFTVNGYTDSGSTGVTEIVLGKVASPVTGKAFSLTYSYFYNGTSAFCYLVYGLEQ